MATPTEIPIATTTLGSAAASYTFSSIPGTYTDLVLVATGKISAGTYRGLLYRVNSDTGTNYSLTYLDADGTTASSGRDVNGTFAVAGLASTTNECVSIAHFQNYANTTTYKTSICRGNSPGYVRTAVSLWRSTSAITSITLFDSAYNLSAGTTLTLYGIN